MGVVTLAWVVIAYWVDNKLQQRDYAGVYANCNKVWATRGLVSDPSQADIASAGNSIETVRHAHAMGAPGTEIDVFFDTTLNQYVVSHDVPYNLKHGELLTLQTLLAAVSDELFIWLDFKHLRDLDTNGVANAVASLEAIAVDTNLKERLYIEGADPVNLGKFAHAGFKTIFDVHPYADTYPGTAFVASIYKLAFYLNDFSVMAMKYGKVDKPVFGSDMQASLGNIPVFIYHVPEVTILEELSALPNVRVLLHHDHSVAHFSATDCQ